MQLLPAETSGNLIGQVHLAECLDLCERVYRAGLRVDMILCDLPYGTTACKWDVIIPFGPLWAHYERIIKDNGAIVLTATQPFATEIINSKRDWFRYDLIWSKNQVSGILNAKRQPLRSHEHILIFYKSPTTYNAQLIPFSETTVQRYRDGDRYVKSEYTSKGTVYNKKEKLDTYIDFKKGRNPGSVLTIKCVHNGNNNRLHATQKPVELFSWLIRSYTNPGDLVLDNCIGSGTTAIACIQEGRNYICFEKDEKYYNVCVERIAKELNKPEQLKLIV